MHVEAQDTLNIKKIGSTKKSPFDHQSSLNAQFDELKIDNNESSTSISTDMATLPTLSSDSSPFIEKYDMDEEAELLGEVRNFIFLELTIILK